MILLSVAGLCVQDATAEIVRTVLAAIVTSPVCPVSAGKKGFPDERCLMAETVRVCERYFC